MSSGIERLKQLRPREYEFKSSPERRCEGFIAHELSEFAPGAVRGEKDEVAEYGTVYEYDGTVYAENVLKDDAESYRWDDDEVHLGEEGEVDILAPVVRIREWVKTHEQPEFQTVDYGKLTPLLTQALKEAVERIETLEARLAVLEENSTES